jgi:hypothetical protein
VRKLEVGKNVKSKWAGSRLFTAIADSPETEKVTLLGETRVKATIISNERLISTQYHVSFPNGET